MSGASGARPAPATPALLEDLHALGALSGLAVLAAAWGYPLWSGAWVVLCPLRELTGIPCPTCYGTRAMVAAAGGHWLTALRLNPLVAVGGMGLFAYIPWAAAIAVGGWPRPQISDRFIARAGWAAGVLVLINWVYLLVAHA